MDIARDYYTCSSIFVMSEKRQLKGNEIPRPIEERLGNQRKPVGHTLPSRQREKSILRPLLDPRPPSKAEFAHFFDCFVLQHSGTGCAAKLWAGTPARC